MTLVTGAVFLPSPYFALELKMRLGNLIQFHFQDPDVATTQPTKQLKTTLVGVVLLSVRKKPPPPRQV
jgi:hypothetical protein